jgi:hypothetical protein
VLPRRAQKKLGKLRVKMQAIDPTGGFSSVGHVDLLPADVHLSRTPDDYRSAVPAQVAKGLQRPQVDSVPAFNHPRGLFRCFASVRRGGS